MFDTEATKELGKDTWAFCQYPPSQDGKIIPVNAQTQKAAIKKVRQHHKINLKETTPVEEYPTLPAFKDRKGNTYVLVTDETKEVALDLVEIAIGNMGLA